jgi:hypothetical protein
MAIAECRIFAADADRRVEAFYDKIQTLAAPTRSGTQAQALTSASVSPKRWLLAGIATARFPCHSSS